MADILKRRRDIIAASSSSLPEWDYEWDSTKGLLNQNNNGWDYITVGSTGYACSISNGRLQFRGSSSNYKYYNYQNTYSTGVIEADMMTSSNAQMRLAFSNGEHSIGIRLQTSSNYKGIYLGTALTTKLVSASASTRYVIRLVLKPNLLGDIYVGGTLVAENVDISNDTVPNIRVTGMGTGSANQYSYLYSLKMKFNRIT